MKMKYYEIPMTFRGVIVVRAYCQTDAENCIEEMSDDEIFNNCYGNWEANGETRAYDFSYGSVNAYDWIDTEENEEDEDDEDEEEDE